MSVRESMSVSVSVFGWCCALGPWSEEQTSEDQYFISGRMVALI